MNLNEPELNIECNNKEADKIEALLLNTLDEHARLSNPVTVIVGLINTLLTVVTRLNVHKGAFSVIKPRMGTFQRNSKRGADS